MSDSKPGAPDGHTSIVRTMTGPRIPGSLPVPPQGRRRATAAGALLLGLGLLLGPAACRPGESHADASTAGSGERPEGKAKTMTTVLSSLATTRPRCRRRRSPASRRSSPPRPTGSPRRRGRSRRSADSPLTTRRTASTPASSAGCPSSRASTSSTRGRGGRALSARSTRPTSGERSTGPSGWSGSRSIAPVAAPTSVTSSRTARSQRASATASTPPR